MKIAVRVKKDNKRLFSLGVLFSGLTAVPTAERAVRRQDIILQFCPWDLAQVEGRNGISGIHEETSLDSASCVFIVNEQKTLVYLG